MSPPAPAVGVPLFGPSAHPDAVSAAGAEPVPLGLPPVRPPGGVALAREWTADATEVSCAGAGLDALLLASGHPEELFGMLLAAARLDLPTVCAAPPGTPLAAVVAALGFGPLSGDAAGVSARLAREGGPRPGGLLDNFSLANALRAGVAAGGGPELLVHLSALAGEAGVVGFPQMARVLSPETPASDPAWTREHGVPALLASLGDGLHDVPTVAGPLKEGLPLSSAAPEEHHRLLFVRARASGAEVVCRVPAGAGDIAGECRVFGSEEEAVGAVRAGGVPEGTVLVVDGCGPRGGPGFLRLDALGAALREAGLRVPVVTDGLPPADAEGTWASMFTPEAVMGGVIGRLRDGDALRISLREGRIRADVGAEELAEREPRGSVDRAGAGYAARYARVALSGLEGAGFG
ncbi:MAG: Dihydroxy-acid dehydratase [uncultured Rubrobacteraceae bacterium]|uniref:Dihydroxy-acid dehydratase n=1 Tax=uncultured Rubrobacteraceae bacterium TaxID=349277 RepID=A0A6J4S1A5_9ACTN|nr:MAG: Dihydroxy-acid dehydratase [uncultured Rubrobacteraceae bacterium]